jgi:hypothetical protein
MPAFDQSLSEPTIQKKAKGAKRHGVRDFIQMSRCVSAYPGDSSRVRKDKHFFIFAPARASHDAADRAGFRH